MRTISLVPSITESLFDLGAGGDVVGITDWCIFPPDLALPRVGGTKNPRIEEIRALAPDLVYLNREENLKRHAEAIAEFARAHISEPKTIDEVVVLLRDLGEIHGRQERAGQLIDELQAARFTAAPFTFLVPIWKAPWMWCGGDTYVSALVESAAGQNLLRGRERYPAMDLDCALALEPDIVFLPDEPYAFTAEDAAAIHEMSSTRVVGPFPGHLFTWHGTRTTLGLRFLRDLLR